MLEFGYIGLTVIMVTLILLGYYQILKKNIDDKKGRNKRFLTLCGGLAFWFAYLIFLSETGTLQDMSLPPKFPLLLFIPFVIFTIIFYIRNKDSELIQSIPNSWTVYYQTFRILVETLLLYTFYKGIIPEQATFEGLNFDVVMGITAPFMAYYVFGDKVKNLTLARGWNILGILMVLFVAVIIGTSFYLPHLWGSEAALTKPEFLTMPYLLIAGFLAPSAIFIHVVSLIQLRKY